jgi:hypothetical protein
MTFDHASHSSDATWQLAHEVLSQIAKARAGFDLCEGEAMLRALRAGAHVYLGYASFAEYIERLFGYKPRWTAERLRVATALETLPEIGRELRDGSIQWSTARELTRVATQETERAWLDACGSRSLRDVESLVAGHKPGDMPDSAPDLTLRRHALRFEVSGETFAVFREAIGKIRRDAGGSLDDDAILLLMARHVLGGPSDAGRANYQVAVTVCEECGRGWHQGRGENIEVGSDVKEMAECDGQRVGHVSSVAGRGFDTCATADNNDKCPSPTPVGAKEERTPKTRARQAIPPVIRRAVIRRDGGRCVVPGCRHAVFVDIHHLVPRSEGGGHDPDELIVLCSAHHRAQHRGQLMIEGRVSTGLVFRHADGTRYGSCAEPRTVAMHLDAFRALRGLGFREGEAKMALEKVRTREGRDTTIQNVLRQALLVLADARDSRAQGGTAHPH